MTSPTSVTTILLRRNTAANWAAKNPILKDGEPAYERDTGKFKIGDGVKPWLQLDYFVPTRLGSIAPQDMTSAQAAIFEHVNSEAPHPVYDDGPSLLLLYQNAKV